MITREVDYAIRTVLSLAARGPDATASTADLAAEMQIPFRFLRQIVRKLVAGGIVASQRGNGGGITLLVAPDKLSLLTILEIIDPRNLKLNTCLVEKANCPRSGYCRVHAEMHRLQGMLEEQLAGITMDKVM